MAELDVSLHQRQEEVEVRRRFRFEPARRGFGCRARHLRAELDRNLDGLVVVTARDPHERAVPGVGIEITLLELVEQAAGLRIDQHLMPESLQQGEVIRPVLEAARRHHRALVPRKQMREHSSDW